MFVFSHAVLFYCHIAFVVIGGRHNIIPVTPTCADRQGGVNTAIPGLPVVGCPGIAVWSLMCGVSTVTHSS